MLQVRRAPYKVPDNVFVHGFITVRRREDVQVARHRHQPASVYLDLGLNPEWLRYYIAAKLNAKVEDIDFNPDDFMARVNSDLIGKYVNIASRAAPFITQVLRRQARARRPNRPPRVRGVVGAARSRTRSPSAYEAREFGKALREVMALADRINEYFDAQQALGAGQGPGASATRCTTSARERIARLPAADDDARSRCCRRVARSASRTVSGSPATSRGTTLGTRARRAISAYGHL